jgi:hypothetical protein
MTYDLTQTAKSRKTVIKMLESLGVEAGWELVQGNGYLYFVSPADQEMLADSSVWTPRVSDLTLADWKDDFQRLTGRGDDLKPLPPKEQTATTTITTSAGRITFKF